MSIKRKINKICQETGDMSFFEDINETVDEFLCVYYEKMSEIIDENLDIIFCAIDDIHFSLSKIFTSKNNIPYEYSQNNTDSKNDKNNISIRNINQNKYIDKNKNKYVDKNINNISNKDDYYVYIYNFNKYIAKPSFYTRNYKDITYKDNENRDNYCKEDYENNVKNKIPKDYYINKKNIDKHNFMLIDNYEQLYDDNLINDYSAIDFNDFKISNSSKNMHSNIIFSATNIDYINTQYNDYVTNFYLNKNSDKSNDVIIDVNDNTDCIININENDYNNQYISDINSIRSANNHLNYLDINNIFNNSNYSNYSHINLFTLNHPSDLYNSHINTLPNSSTINSSIYSPIKYNSYSLVNPYICTNSISQDTKNISLNNNTIIKNLNLPNIIAGNQDERYLIIENIIPQYTDDQHIYDQNTIPYNSDIQLTLSIANKLAQGSSSDINNSDINNLDINNSDINNSDINNSENILAEDIHIGVITDNMSKIKSCNSDISNDISNDVSNDYVFNDISNDISNDYVFNDVCNSVSNSDAHNNISYNNVPNGDVCNSDISNDVCNSDISNSDVSDDVFSENIVVENMDYEYIFIENEADENTKINFIIESNKNNEHNKENKKVEKSGIKIVMDENYMNRIIDENIVESISESDNTSDIKTEQSVEEKSFWRKMLWM